MDIENLQKQVQDIFGIVSQLRVSGDAVDYVAAVREKLRRLYADIGAMAEKEDTDGGQDNG